MTKQIKTYRVIHLKKISVMNFYKVVIFVIFLFIGFSSSNVFAETIPFWRFEPDVYKFVQGDTLNLTAVLCNDSSATNDLIASTVAYGAGYSGFTGENLYIEFVDMRPQLSSVILHPGDCHNFSWGIVTSSWKVVPSGQYTVDYASINGHNWSGAIVADNVFTINVTRDVHVPEPISLGVLHLLLKK